MQEGALESIVRHGVKEIQEHCRGDHAINEELMKAPVPSHRHKDLQPLGGKGRDVYAYLLVEFSQLYLHGYWFTIKGTLKDLCLL